MYWLVRASLTLVTVMTVLALALPAHTIDGGWRLVDAEFVPARVGHRNVAAASEGS
jgi:hypothetical protein